MSTQWTQEKWKETIKQLYQRAATDPGFRQLCLKDGAAAIKAINGLDLPPGTKVRFIEPTDGLVLTLPAIKSEGELSDRELEMVSGAFAALSTTSSGSTCPPPGQVCSNLF